MTSAVTSSFSRSYSDQQEDSADEKKCARNGMSCDDINLDVITISSWLSEQMKNVQQERQSVDDDISSDVIISRMLFGVSDGKTMSFT
ncbi:hypothetical protein F511_09719 [Dorcoceras hygrometricum]|uniref:Uncharacterized protein n=1 Tax=Dorcoceras hygrometricum TaxID=472368 RepID=A0A2Z7D444_9LAMI|nr:hypothetical protein F511_09719 [Dorcoceras hygrometricum]